MCSAGKVQLDNRDIWITDGRITEVRLYMYELEDTYRGGHCCTLCEVRLVCSTLTLGQDEMNYASSLLV